jgi:HPt (histidine-containing phosphotransfer) domain-containing protein
MDDYVAKPIRTEELFAVLGRWIGWENEQGEAVTAADRASAWTRAPGGETGDDGIDASILDDILELSEDGGLDLVRELIAIFFGEAPARLDHLRSGIVEDDAARVCRAAHAMKGGAGNIGASRLAAYCGQLEQQARAGCLDGAATIAGAVEIELERARCALERRIAALAAAG